MNILKQIGHQGDTQWFSIDKLPNNAVKTEKKFIAKSEQSGSVHVLCGDYKMYEVDGGNVIDVKNDCVLNHTFETNLIANESINIAKELPVKDHRSSVIPKGKYFVGIQRRYDPLNKLWKDVVD